MPTVFKEFVLSPDEQTGSIEIPDGWTVLSVERIFATRKYSVMAIRESAPFQFKVWSSSTKVCHCGS